MSEETGWRSAPKDFREAPRSPERRPAGDIPEIYEFGPFRLEPAERKLSRGNEVVSLTPKGFDTLHLLVRNSGHLLEKDELIRTLWPDSFVEEGNLTTNVFLLRKALGQDPEYIETVPKKGYRFVGAVRRLPTAELMRPEKPRPGESESAAKPVAPHPAVSLEPTHGPTIAVPCPAPPVRDRVSTSFWAKRAIIATMAMMAVGAVTYIAIDKVWISKHQAPSLTPPTAPASVTPAAFAPPPHSIAVLPFANLSGDASQDYFSDGIAEELLSSLARINELQVVARTSSFSFKGKDADISTIAHKLNVASVLEGSVRRAGNTIRITAQLNDGATGFRLWSQTYDRDLSNVLQLQTEIANAVASALKVALLGDVAAKIEVGGTRNPAAFDAYLRAVATLERKQNEKGVFSAISEYADAVNRDPDFALAYAGRSQAFAFVARNIANRRTRGDYFNKAKADASKAIALAPDLAEGHLALAITLSWSLEFAAASQEYERALSLAPGNARVLGPYGGFAVWMGRTEAGLAAVHRSVLLDPLSARAHFFLGHALSVLGRYGEALAAFKDAKALNPNDVFNNMWLATAYYSLGDYQSALAGCEYAQEDEKPICLALVYDKIGRHADAEAALAKLAACDTCAMIYASIYLAWGDRGRSLDWLETAMRHRDPYLVYVKADTQWDLLRAEPRFQAIEKALKFPD